MHINVGKEGHEVTILVGFLFLFILLRSQDNHSWFLKIHDVSAFVTVSKTFPISPQSYDTESERNLLRVQNNNYNQLSIKELKLKNINF